MGQRLKDTSTEKIADGLDYASHGLRVQAKTADYTVVAADNGKMFTTRGAAGTVIFTLPAVTSAFTGHRNWFVNLAAQTMTISGTAGELVTFNDLAANTVSLQTGSELIGGGFMVVCDGTSWLVLPMTEETQTVTVAT